MLKQVVLDTISMVVLGLVAVAVNRDGRGASAAGEPVRA